MVLVDPLRISSSLTSSRSVKSSGSGISSAVTSQGPRGPNPDAFLLLAHRP